VAASHGRGENTMKYTLIVINSHGASYETYHSTKSGIRTQIRLWDKPETMTARIFDVAGHRLYDGPALGF
jgi:hypothetical protein